MTSEIDFDFEKAELVSTRRVTSERVVTWYYIKFHGTLLELGDNERNAVDLFSDLRRKSMIEKDDNARRVFARDESRALAEAAGLKQVLGAWLDFTPVEGSPEWAKLGKLAPVWEKLSMATRVAVLIMAGIEPQ